MAAAAPNLLPGDAFRFEQPNRLQRAAHHTTYQRDVQATVFTWSVGSRRGAEPLR